MSNEVKINVTPKGDAIVLEHRTGEALKLHDPHRIDIKGDLNAPQTFFDCRKDQFPAAKSYCHCSATLSQLTIQLVGDDREVDRIVVTGVGKSNPEMDIFAFGSGQGHTIDGLVKILRRKRHMFPEPEIYKGLLNSLTNFKAKVDSTIESNKDTRGNVKTSLDKIVKTDVPDSFVIDVQPYLNGPKQKLVIETEVTATAENVTVALYAFDLESVKKVCATAVFGEATETIAKSGIPVILDFQF